LLEVLHKDNFI